MITLNKALNELNCLREMTPLLQRELSLSDSVIRHTQKVSSVRNDMYLLEAKKYASECAKSSRLQEEILVKKKQHKKTIVGVGLGGALLGVIIGSIMVK